MDDRYIKQIAQALTEGFGSFPVGLPGGAVPTRRPRGKQILTRNDAVGATLWSGQPMLAEHSRICPQAHGYPSDGRCWHYGCKPYRCMRIAMQTPAEGFTGEFGATVRVEVGDPDWGTFVDSREFIIGPGAPVCLALGEYPNVTVRIVDASTTFPPIAMAWMNGDASVVGAGGAAGLLVAPVTAAVSPGINRVPNGAREVFIETACTIIWRVTDDNLGAKTLNEAVGAGSIVRVKGQNFSVSVATKTQFYLAPL
jgi:hypothetical protein